jgi:hypothetical protein
MICKIVFWAFLVLYVVALALFVVGYFGLFNSPSGPLDGIFLIPLGMPWNFVGNILPEWARMWFGLAAPLINLLIIRALCQRFGTS